MRDFETRLRATSTALAMLAVTSCGGSAVLLQSLDGGSSGSSDASNIDSADAALSADGSTDAIGSFGDANVDAAADAIADAAHVCGDLPARDLNSIADVKAALTASPAFPFPGGWGPCGETILVCPSSAPDISFNQDLTMLLCGGNSESGFNTTVSYPMTVVDTGVKASFELRVQTDAGVKSYVLIAQGQLGGLVGFKLLEPDVTKTQWVTFEALNPLP